MENPLRPGKSSSEFMISITAILAFVILVALDKITLTQSMMETVFQLAMVYVGGRALPKTAQQLQGMGSGKALEGLTLQLVDALKIERQKEST